MWKTYCSTDNVFWDANTIDKPSKEYIDNMNWEQLDLNISMQDTYVVQTQSNRKDLGLLKLVNEETNETLYYMLKRIKKYTKHTYNLEYELDTWTTYNLDILEQDVEVLVERHQDYEDEKYLEFDDEELNKLDLSFKSNKFEKTYFNANGITYENGEFKIKYGVESDIINACYCLVLNYNKDDFSPYTFIPILSRSKNLVITSKVEPFDSIKMFPYRTHWQPSDIRYGDSRWQTEFNFYRQYEYSDKFIELKNLTNNRVKVRLKEINKSGTQQTWRTIFDEDLTNVFKNVQNIENIVVRTDGKGNVFTIQWQTQDSRIEVFDTNGDYDEKRWTKLYSKVMQNNVEYENNTQTTIEFSIDKKFDFNDERVNNSLTKINNIIKSQQYANKINGIYVIPNVLNFTKQWKSETILNDKVLTLDIPQHGNKINDIKLFDNIQISNNLVFNNELPIFKSIYKYCMFNWLGNWINASHFIDKNNVVVNGNVNFTNTFNILANNSLKDNESNLLTFPAQQPLKSDTFNKYVQANMESLNTGYAIQKQQSIIGGFNGVFGSILNGIIGSALGGNVLGGINAAGGAINSVVGSVMNVKNFEKQTRAKYRDLDNTMGNNLLFSATKDSIWNYQLCNEQKQYDLVQYLELTEDSIMQMNNTLLLNGVYNPKYFTLNNLPKSTKHLGFYYAKLNPNNFNQVFSKYINESRETKDIILNNLLEFRVWDKVPEIK